MISDRMLARTLRYVLDQPLMLRLYTATDPNTDQFTEMSGSGYSPKVYTLNDWAIVSMNPTLAEGAVSEFRFTGTQEQTILGAYLTDRNGDPLWASAFKPEPLKIGRRGDIIPVRPIFRLGSVAADV